MTFCIFQELINKKINNLIMLRAVKIRLYPNKEQATQINKLLGCCRFVYNQCLARKIN